MRSRPEDLQDFAKQIERDIRKSDKTDSMHRLVCRLLTGKDQKVASFMAAKWVEWRFGKATETVKISGTLTHEHRTITEQLTDDELAQVENLIESANARGNQE